MYRQSQDNINTVNNYNKMFIELKERDGVLDHSVDYKHSKVLGKFKGGKLIDMGCLNSPLGVMAQKLFPDAKITLLDFAPSVIEFWENNYPFETVLSDCRNTPFADNTFDFAVAEEVMEHLDEPESLIKEAIRIIKPGGMFVLTVPNDEYNNEYGGGYHIWSFKENDVLEILKKYGEAGAEIIPKEGRKGYIMGWVKK
jgi:ubiquinone/menaquinone biosynthesis C-methylase UbiE